MNKKTKLLSLDVSSTSTGWAYFENCEYIKSGTLTFNTKEYKGQSDKRLEAMCLSIIDLLRSVCPDIIVIEKLNVGRNINTTRILSKITGVIYGYSILVDDCFYFEIQPSQWRSQLGMQSSKLKREEFKQLAIDYIKDRYGKVVCDDEADSICAGLGYIKMFT